MVSSALPVDQLHGKFILPGKNHSIHEFYRSNLSTLEFESLNQLKKDNEWYVISTWVF